MKIRPISDREIELSATHAGEMARVLGRQEQERRALLTRHQDEAHALRDELGITDDDQAVEGNPVPELPRFVADLLARVFSGGGVTMGEFSAMGAPPFAGAVAPPVDAPPGMPVALGMGSGCWFAARSSNTGDLCYCTLPARPEHAHYAPNVSPGAFWSLDLNEVMEGPTFTPPVVKPVGTAPDLVIPPPTTPARAPMPGTGKHPGCTVDNPCTMHGGTTPPQSMPVGGVMPGMTVAPPPAATNAHYDGRTTPAPVGDCTIYKPCKECIDRSRRPTAVPAGGAI